MTAVSQESSSLTDIIRAEIKASGVISFARFMELSLYHPKYGYYEMDASRIGRGGDFITSVSIGEAFGQLLASRFAKWLDEIEGAVRIVEIGAHDGQLAYDMLVWLSEYNQSVFSRLKYTIIESSGKRRDWQTDHLAEFDDHVEYFHSLSEMPEIGGIIYTNELLDAFPVHRICWSASKRDWFELGVSCDAKEFCWVTMQGRSSDWRSLLPAWPDSLLDILPDGYNTEISPAAIKWWQTAARHLGKGKLVAFDYGHGPDEWPSPSQHRGTVRGYHKHKRIDNILANPGGQDITAHANFHLIKKQGESAGLTTEQFTSQERFLGSVFAELVQGFPELAQKIDLRHFQALVHPAQMGRSFQVLVQSI